MQPSVLEPIPPRRTFATGRTDGERTPTDGHVAGRRALPDRTAAAMFAPAPIRPGRGAAAPGGASRPVDARACRARTQSAGPVAAQFEIHFTQAVTRDGVASQ